MAKAKANSYPIKNTGFSEDRAAIDREFERLKPLIDPGASIPCPDPRIPPEEWRGQRPRLLQRDEHRVTLVSGA